nr:hypothetical protein MANES_01G196300 [Ipomoea batatas]GME11790.1 hypothetical protein MANES_01G196300 [Ipomoea batatas]
MAHQFLTAIFVACFVITVASVVLAHEGHHHGPSPSPSATKDPSSAIIASLPSTMAALFAFVFSFLVIRGRV